MSKLPAGPAKTAPPKSSTSIVVVHQDPGLIFGLKRNVVIGILAVLVAVVGLAVWGPFGGGDDESDEAVAGKKGKGRGGKGKAIAGGGKSLCAAVHCSEEQKAKIKPLMAAYQESIDEDEKALQQAYASLGTAYSEDSYADGELDEAYDAIAEHNAAIEAAARQTLAQVHEYLTPDQREIVGRLVSRDGPTSLFDKKSRGIPDRRVTPNGKKDKKQKKNVGLTKEERREAKRARREARGAAEGEPGSEDDPDARAVELRRRGPGRAGPFAKGLRPENSPDEQEADFEEEPE